MKTTHSRAICYFSPKSKPKALSHIWALGEQEWFRRSWQHRPALFFVSVIKGRQYTIGGWPQLRLSLAKDISKSSETVANGQSVYCKDVFTKTVLSKRGIQMRCRIHNWISYNFQRHISPTSIGPNCDALISLYKTDLLERENPLCNTRAD